MTDKLEDWVLVPREPTDAMLASMDVLVEHTIKEPRLAARAIYEDFLAAAPSHPASDAVAKLVEAAQAVVDASNNDADTVNFLIALKCDAALAAFNQSKGEEE